MTIRAIENPPIHSSSSHFPATIAVTGGTGFIGRHLLPALLSNGHKVRALVRGSRNPISSNNLTWVSGDLNLSPALDELMQGADCVIHLAGVVRGVSHKDFESVNVTGCNNIFESVCKVAPKARFLLISSLAARHPKLSHYASSKRKAEDLLQLQNFLWTIFRPTAVYGAGDSELLPLFRIIAKGFMPVAGARDARISLLYVADLVSAVLAWIAHPQSTAGRCYELADSYPNSYTWAEVGEIIAGLSGKSVTSVKIPDALLKSVAWTNRLLASVLGYAPMLTPEKVREILHPDWQCSSFPAEQDFGWTARYKLQDGLQALPGWL